MTRQRRFHAGQTFTFDGITFRVQQGDKRTADGTEGVDLRLDWYTPDGRWVAIGMGTVAFMADFLFENEDVLYPPPRYQGGGKFWGFIRHAMKHGHEKAIAGLNAEKDAKQRQMSFEVQS